MLRYRPKHLSGYRVVRAEDARIAELSRRYESGEPLFRQDERYAPPVPEFDEWEDEDA